MMALAWLLLVLALGVGAFALGGWLAPWAYWVVAGLVVACIIVAIVRILQHKRLAE